MILLSKENYDRFIGEFSSKLAKKHPKVCFYAYGSYVDGNCNYGRSDIDGGLILDSGIVTLKDIILDIAEIFANALKTNPVKTQFNLLDRETCRDGRFLSYTLDYTKWIKSVGKIISGPDYLKYMNGLDFKSGVLHTAAYNFRKAKNNLLYSLDMISTEPKRFREKTERVLETLAKFPKVLIWLRGEDVIPSRIKARKKLEKMLGYIDLTFIEQLEHLLKHPAKFYSKLEDNNQALQLSREALTTMESMIQAYIRKYPVSSPRELKVTSSHD